MITPSRDAEAAAHALLAGHLVALPTETVYGLAARADDPAAVARIYAAKGRPRTHPVIVHVASGPRALDTEAPGGWVSAVPDYARALADACWPGPLTLVLPRSPRATDDITGAQDTVAIRVPSHPVAQAVLRAMDEAEPMSAPHGVAAPSANRFGRVSPTTADHVIHELGDVLDANVDVVLDGGSSAVGVESTIVDCTGAQPRILRPGGISAARIAEVTGLAVASQDVSDIRVPGALPSHYAPAARVIVTDHPPEPFPHSAGLIAPADVPTPDGVVRLASPVDSADYARVLYAALREADSRGLAIVIAVPPRDDDAGLAPAVLDRLTRAASRDS